MNAVALKRDARVHPHKFALWVAIGSIIMMFAGLTSAYIVKRNQPRWQTFDLPWVFWVSTIVIVLSSLTIRLALKKFKNRDMDWYKSLMLTTSLLGVLFIELQLLGFSQLMDRGFTLTAGPSYSFLYVIIGLHAVHVIGGVIALWVITAKAFSQRVKIYSPVSTEVIATYWHFVDILWIYLLVFLWMIR